MAQNSLQHAGVVGLGLASSILTAGATALIAKFTGLNVFTFSVWAIVPVGALLTGFAAASGYYFGSLLFRRRPSMALLAEMLIVAGLTQFLIYYFEYASLVLSDGTQASDVVGFTDYLQIYLTKTHYTFGRRMMDAGEAGSFGYVMAAVQLAGFLVGGLSVFGFLRSLPVCATCDVYLKKIASRVNLFLDSAEATAYYDALVKLPPNSREFVEMCRAQSGKKDKGTIQTQRSLLGCPHCKSQVVRDQVKVLKGSDWRDIPEMSRCVGVPRDIDLTPMFLPTAGRSAS